MPSNKLTLTRTRVEGESVIQQLDVVAVEEPLQVRLAQGELEEIFSLTLRTPGQDNALVYGLLFSEGVINQAEDILSIRQENEQGQLQENQLTVVLRQDLELDWLKKTRRYPSYSGCGLCGKTSLQALELAVMRDLKPVQTRLDAGLVKQLKAMLAAQPLFSETGGVHGAGLIPEKAGKLDFDAGVFFEDVGRHNALDKLIGQQLVDHDLQQHGILVLSGRIGFELVQKAIRAGYSLIVALGAPSSLAVQAANQFGVSLVGFAKDLRFNCYTVDSEEIIKQEQNWSE